MFRRTVAALIVLIAVLVVIIAIVNHKHKNEQAVSPTLSVSAFNQSQKLLAAGREAHPGDVIVYTLNAENQSDQTIQGYVLEASLNGVSDKATLIDAQGASFNSATNSLVWTPLDIPANGSIQKQFSVRINPVAAGANNPTLTMRFNNEISIPVAVPHVSGTTTTNPAAKTKFKAPVSGPESNLSLWFAILATLGFAVFRRYRNAWG